MKLEFREKTFSVGDAVFTTKELSKDEFFIYSEFKHVNERYSFATDRITKIDNLQNSNGDAISASEFKKLESIPYAFIITFLTEYGNCIFSDLTKAMSDKAKSAEKNDESPTA